MIPEENQSVLPERSSTYLLGTYSAADQWPRPTLTQRDRLEYRPHLYVFPHVHTCLSVHLRYLFAAFYRLLSIVVAPTV